MDSPTRKVCKVTGPFVPAYSHPGDAGADLKAPANAVVPSRGKCLVSTGLHLALPEGHVGLIWPRSGLAVKHSIDCGAGVIDAQYRGEVKVLLFNHSDEDFSIQAGDRIAQLLVQKVESINFLPVDELDDTSRNNKGFGSTGAQGSPAMGIAINQLKTKLVWGNISDYLTGSTGFRRVVLALFDGKGFDVLKKKLASIDLP